MSEPIFAYDTAMVSADCYFGDHEWRGGVCVGCGERFRCVCGVYLKVENLDKHADSCRWLQSRLELAARLPRSQEPR